MKKLLISLVAMMAMGCKRHLYYKDGCCYEISSHCISSHTVIIGKAIMSSCDEYMIDTSLISSTECPEYHSLTSKPH